MILFLKHTPTEGPDTLQTFFQRKGIPTKTLELSLGDRLPENLSDVALVVSLGGPMNVYEEDKYPFLRDENPFIQKILREEVPFLGLCLGAQLLAKAAGARVVKSPVQEMGFDDIVLTDAGQQDPLFQGIDTNVTVFQWHGDMFEIPSSGKLLATAQGCPHQAFKVGLVAYGFQFHIEVTDQSIRDWSDASCACGEVLPTSKEKMLADYAELKNKFHATADRIYENFWAVVRETPLSRISNERMENATRRISTDQHHRRQHL